MAFQSNKTIKQLAYYLIFGLCLINYGCSSGSDGQDNTPEPILDPVAAVLIYPEQDKTCTTGTIISEEKSTILFEWNASEHTTLYDVTIKNLNNNALFTKSTSDTQLSLEVDRSAPYQWWVTSKATGTTVTAKSNLWKFYNEGPGISNYAPFPAEAIAPKRGSTIDFTGAVDLEWSGSDVDNDALEFEVFMDAVSPPSTSLGKTTMTTLNTSIQSATVYYWRVISVDEFGNSSSSEIFEFKAD